MTSSECTQDAAWSTNEPRVMTQPAIGAACQLMGNAACTHALIAAAQAVAPFSGAASHLAPLGSIQRTYVRVMVPGTQEATVGGAGHKVGASKAAVLAGRARSRLCRSSLAAAAIRTMTAHGVQCTGADQVEGVATTMTYRQLRLIAAPAYVDAWRQLRQHVPLFRPWIPKPPQLIDFRIELPT
jgi:hypothetical protein